MDFSSHNPTTSNSLNLAARNNDVENVRRLLKKINPNCVDNRGWTCLHEAAHSDSYECLELILKHPDCRPLVQTHGGHTALYVACRDRASVKTITYLLENVKDIANYCSTEGVTPLHEVCDQGRLEIIQLLIDYGAKINVQDSDGDTPLHDACIARQSDAIKLLLHAGADPNIQNERWFTPFHIACNTPCLESVVHLKDFIKDIDQRVDTGDTPLMISLHTDNDLIPCFLLENGADPHLKNNDGKLALDIAMEYSSSYVFNKLLEETDNDFINESIIWRACKPHYFSLAKLGALLSSDLGPRFFQYVEPYLDANVDVMHELKTSYVVHSPLNAYLGICDYIYMASQETFREYFNYFLMRDVPVNPVQPGEFPPLVYIHYCSHTNCFEDVRLHFLDRSKYLYLL